MLERVVIPFSGGSSLSKDGTWVSCIEGRFFTIWATREAQQTKTELQDDSYVAGLKNNQGRLE